MFGKNAHTFQCTKDYKTTSFEPFNNTDITIIESKFYFILKEKKGKEAITTRFAFLFIFTWEEVKVFQKEMVLSKTILL